MRMKLLALLALACHGTFNRACRLAKCLLAAALRNNFENMPKSRMP